MPTEFVAQNGVTLHQNNHIAVTGCPKAKTLTRTQKLTKALKVCHNKHGAKRAACERTARQKYGAVKNRQKKKSA